MKSLILGGLGGVATVAGAIVMPWTVPFAVIGALYVFSGWGVNLGIRRRGDGALGNVEPSARDG